MAIFYVSTVGSDSNPGTAALPFASVTHACTTAIGGDKIIITPGVYSQTGAAQLKGAVTLQGQPGAIIDGGNLSISLVRVLGPDALIIGMGFRNIRDPDDSDNEKAPPAVVMEGAEIINVKVRECSFDHVGMGVAIEGGASGCNVIKCLFEDVDYTAIMFRDGAHHCLASGNTMRRIGFRYGEGGAIGIHGSHNIGVSFCLIEDAAYHGINEQNHGAPIAGGNVYERNLIRRACVMSDDGGGIYAFKRGNLPSHWRDNYVEAVGHPDAAGRIAWGIYLDDLVANITVIRNQVVACRSGIMVHGGENNAIVSNIVRMTLGAEGWPGAFGLQVQECDPSDGEDGLSKNLNLSGNVVEASMAGAVGATFPVVVHWFRNNHYVMPGGELFGFDFNQYALWTGSGGDAESVVYTDYFAALAGSGLVARPLSYYGPQ